MLRMSFLTIQYDTFTVIVEEKLFRKNEERESAFVNFALFIVCCMKEFHN